ncbi:hypothetical protein KAYACHO_89 [Mycobacterium phage KayaCho]|uniref:hypothetical protein n=1 Tax=Mycobacterium phage KayaCho TaxID=1340830 RepID=UPI0003881870|nr:hypothetical protein N846_gp89 [Mycobacterium phage KayaCho]AGT12993.1 hypothetical protein KAYACHO_89 [Mycobacterium phage KayaCho]
MANNIVAVTAGAVEALSEDHGVTTMFGAMMELVELTGAQITWTTVTWNVLIGTYADGETGTEARVAVFDLDTANGMDVIRVTNYVNGHTDDRPEVG